MLAYLPMPEAVRADYLARLAAACPDAVVSAAATLDEAEAALPHADIFLSFGVQLKRDPFACATRLQWMHALGTGLDGIIDAPSLSRDVIVTSTRGIHGAPLSELALLQMLALARDFPRSVRAQDRQAWERWPARLLSGKTVGILGVGLIAEALAPRCKAMGMEVVGISRSARDLPGFDRFHPRDDLAGIAGQLDFLVLLIPLSDDTRDIVDRRVIAAMKPDACVVNLARGGVIDEAALVEALHAGKLGGAALDTFAREPLPPGDPVWTAPRMIVTPHLGGFYDGYPEEVAKQFGASYASFAAGNYAAMLNRESGWGIGRS